MAALLIIVGYVVVWLVYGWRLSVYLIDKEIREWRKASDGRMVAGRFESKYVHRSNSVVDGFFVAFFWPVTMPIRGAYRLMSGRGLFITPVEREIEQEQRLKELERIVREYKLPMPKDDQQ